GAPPLVSLVGNVAAPLSRGAGPMNPPPPAGNVPPAGHRAPTAKASLHLRDVTWTPQPADIRDAAARTMHFWLGRASEGRLRFQRRRGRFDDSRTACRGSARRQRCDRAECRPARLSDLVGASKERGDG